MNVWQAAQVALASCSAKRCRAVVLGVMTGGVMFTLAGGGGTLPHRTSSKTNFPRWTGSVESALAKVASSAGCVSRPARCFGSSMSLPSAAGVAVP